MANVASVDYASQRLYLHADTVAGGFDVIAAYFEVCALRAANVYGEQHYPNPLSAEGNIAKGGGRFTPRYGVLAAGWRLVPYDAAHLLRILVEILSADGISDVSVFDRSTVVSHVDIDIAYRQVEVVQVSVDGVAAAALASLQAAIDDQAAILLALTTRVVAP